MSTDGFSPAADWRVVSFIDPAGNGKDFAFTQGLTAFELPELLLWARPTEGFDPGVDWLLTHRERSTLLSRWALEMMADQLGEGAQREERFDGGTTIARFRFGRALRGAYLHHPQLPEQARVLSIAWSLVRPDRARPEPPEPPLSPAIERRMRGWIAQTEARMDPAGFENRLAALSITAPGRPRFGPMTPWVDARITQVLAAGPEVLTGFLGRQHLAGYARCEGCLLESLEQLATRSRRNSFCREALRAAQELAAAVIGGPDHPTEVWDQVLAEVLLPLHPGDHESMESALGVCLTDGLEELLLTALLTDRAPASLIANGTGPWEWAIGDQLPPGRRWLAAPEFRRTARELLARATPDQLVTATERAGQPFGLDERFTMGQLISGLQTTAPASARPGQLFRRDQRRGLPRSIVQTAEHLAGQLLTAIALPDRFPPEHWDLIRDTIYPIAPDLPQKTPWPTTERVRTNQ
jgi:hypothetical protein